MANEKSKRKTVGTILILTVIAVLAIYYVLSENHIIRLGSNTYSGTISFDGSRNEKLVAYQNIIACVSNNNVIFYEKSGSIAYPEVKIQAKTPFVNVAEKFMLVADRNGNKVYIFANGKLNKTIETEYPIINAKINSKGSFVIATTEQGYKALVTVYSIDGSEIYKWHSADSYVVDVDISPSGKNMVAAVANAEGGNIGGGIAVFDMSSNETEAVSAKIDENTLALSVKYVNNDRIVLVCDNKLIGYDRLGEPIYRADYYGRKLHNFRVAGSGEIALALSESKGGVGSANSLIMVYNPNGVEKAAIRVENGIRILDIEEGIVVYNDNREVAVSDLSGREMGRVTPKRDVKDIVLLSGSNEFVLVSGSNADVVKW